MKQLSLTEPLPVDEIGEKFNLTTKLKNGIRLNFGDPISINELKKISMNEFLSHRGFGLISWRQFQNGMKEICPTDQAVTLVHQLSRDNIIVEIDTSRSFSEVFEGLAEIMKSHGITSNY